jgi:hypothetical protein
MLFMSHLTSFYIAYPLTNCCSYRYFFLTLLSFNICTRDRRDCHTIITVSLCSQIDYIFIFTSELYALVFSCHYLVFINYNLKPFFNYLWNRSHSACLRMCLFLHCFGRRTLLGWHFFLSELRMYYPTSCWSVSNLLSNLWTSLLVVLMVVRGRDSLILMKSLFLLLSKCPLCLWLFTVW